MIKSLDKYILFAALLSIGIACNTSPPEKIPSGENTEEANPPAEGFNKENSDARAIAIADRVMEAQGGREAWDNMGTVAWNFFGARELAWNKKTGDVRIFSPRDSTTYIVNIHSLEGKIAVKGKEINDSTKTAYLEKARNIWINDSYWLFMPFKLKDTGVTLTYSREDTTLTGVPAHVLQLTFDKVGVTPQNKYEVWVDQSGNLVKQWAFFQNTKQDSASFTRPWDNYKKYGDLLLSADRSDDGGPKNVRILDTVPEGLFSDLSEISW